MSLLDDIAKGIDYGCEIPEFACRPTATIVFTLPSLHMLRWDAIPSLKPISGQPTACDPGREFGKTALINDHKTFPKDLLVEYHFNPTRGITTIATLQI
jgi:hypothetical protein